MRKKSTIHKIDFQIANEERFEYFLKMSHEDRLKYLQKLRKLMIALEKSGYDTGQINENELLEPWHFRLGDFPNSIPIENKRASNTYKYLADAEELMKIRRKSKNQ